MYQLGCFLPHGVSLLQCIIPEEGLEEAKQHPTAPLVQLKGGHYVQHPGTKQLERCCSEKVALAKFLQFLERGKSSSRPAYDGVVLVSHILEAIPPLVKAVKKHKMEQQFLKTVKGLGDVCTFISKSHSRRFLDESNPSSQMNISLNVVHERLFGRKLHLAALTSEDKARVGHEILVNLLDDNITYKNFFKEFSHPPGSAVMTRLTSYRSVRERMELFRPLEKFISQELARQQVDLLVTGLYAPSGRITFKMPAAWYVSET